MKFFEKYFTKHHLVHSPHKWFLAFLSSPIHFAEIHYKKVYHLNYIHAKKLFLFDMILLASILVISSITIFWWTYDPTITDLIYINIEQPNTKIKSGDYIEYKITYKNESEIKIENPILKIELPEGFVLDKTNPDNFNKNKKEFNLENLASNESNIITMSGWFYGTPNEHHLIHAKLSYNQEGKNKIEEKSIPLITIPRGSVLETQIDVEDNIIYLGQTEIIYKIKNSGEQTIKNIKIPLETDYFFTNDELNTIEINELKPQDEKTFSTTLNLKDTRNATKIDYTITPSIEINNIQIDQETVSHSFNILHPKLDANTNWENNITTSSPGKTLILNLTLKNTGDINLTDLEINIPIDTAIIDTTRITALNNSSFYSDKNLKISKLPNLENLNKNEESNLIIYIPILTYPQGTDIKLSLTPIIKSNVDNLNKIFDIETKTEEVKIGTNIFLSKDVKYYTVEGDQIGRGPNPPQINKESKYWVFLEMENTSSKIKNLSLNTTLSDNINFTGKTSVSKGNNIIFTEKNKNIYWELNSLNPHEKVGIYFEIAFIPKDLTELNNKQILKSITITAFDNYIETNIELYNENLILK